MSKDGFLFLVCMKFEETLWKMTKNTMLKVFQSPNHSPCSFNSGCRHFGGAILETLQRFHLPLD